jgi:hypothetical protein
MTHIDTYKLQSISPWNPEHAFEPDSKYLTPYLDFETKDEYVAWRAEWKTAYAALSERIRELRTEWRAEGSVHDAARHNALFSSRALARSLLTLRKASKLRAEQLYQASKATAEVA